MLAAITVTVTRSVAGKSMSFVNALNVGPPLNVDFNLSTYLDRQQASHHVNICLRPGVSDACLSGAQQAKKSGRMGQGRGVPSPLGVKYGDKKIVANSSKLTLESTYESNKFHA